MGEECTECQSGFYKAETGSGSCLRCPENTEPLPGTGNTGCREFPVCILVFKANVLFVHNCSSFKLNFFIK